MEKRRVLITGAARGIGAVAARTFGEGGYRVAICDRDEAALAKFRTEMPDALAIACDVSIEHQVIAMAGIVGSELGGLDCLISNVGVPGPTGALVDIEYAEWSDTLRCNLDSHYFCAKYLHPHLRSGESSSMVMTASVAGRLGYALRAPYAASKWATIGLMKTLAKEWALDGVRVNAVLPGIVNGPRMDLLIKSRSLAQNRLERDVLLELTERAAIGRMIEMDEVADLMFFLCSGKARAINGQALSVCGGLEQL